jgi:uncharacterized membrane protein YjgN (DUF898 family)
MTTDELGGPPPIEMPSLMTADGRPAPTTLTVSYRGEGSDLFLIMLKNLFLTLITLGLYSAWAKTTQRGYLWKQVQIGDDRLDYRGTGKELFIGYLKVAGCYLVFFGIPAVVGHFAPQAGLVLRALGVLLIMVILPYAIYWSRRYLLGRTRWRGIRFGLAGEAGDFAKVWLIGGLLTVITLGFYAPVLGNRVYGTLMRNTRYGSAAFRYDGRDGDAFRIAFKGILLSLITLGIYYPWYVAAIRRFRLAHTHFDRATGVLDITGRLVWKLTVVNLFGMILTLGIATPWLVTYTLRTVLDRLSFQGAIDFSQITQQARSGDAAGDTLASALGVELGI